MRSSYIVCAVILLASCHGGAPQITVSEAWVRLPAVPGQPAAAYFTIHGGRRAGALVQIESALAKRTEMHESMNGTGGMTMMAPLDHVDVPAGRTVPFDPGGRHAMLIGLDPIVRPGTAVPLRFGFSDGTTAEAEAKSVGASEDRPY